MSIGESQDAHKQVYGDGGYENQAKFSHEIVAGGAAFEGMKLFEDHQRKEGSRKTIRLSMSPYTDALTGKQVSHAFAKELLAGFVGGEVDKLAETKGMDAYDRREAHKHAKDSAERMYDDHYINQEGADQYDPNQYGRPGRLDY